MNFWPSDDQIALQAGIRSFLAGRFPIEDVRAREETGQPIDRERWTELAEMGVFSMREAGLGLRDAVLAFEELGRALVPGPLVTTHIAAGLVGGAADGSAIVGRLDPRPIGDLVEHPHQCDAFLHFVDGRLEVVEAATLQFDDVPRPLDPLSPLGVRRPGAVDGRTIAEAGDAEALHHAGVVLTAALALGVALAATEIANAYAKERVQFGRPIGGFQAVKHLLAEMLVKAEVARAAVYAAACALDGASDDDPAQAVHVAKAVASEAAAFCGKTGIQVHGGMGFTWEVDAQRYWKRAMVLDKSFGSADFHARAVAAGIRERPRFGA
jgi:alkylation response protein AidB-like acyl-CoA dehydrogenase